MNMDLLTRHCAENREKGSPLKHFASNCSNKTQADTTALVNLFCVQTLTNAPWTLTHVTTAAVHCATTPLEDTTAVVSLDTREMVTRVQVSIEYVLIIQKNCTFVFLTQLLIMILWNSFFHLTFIHPTWRNISPR